MQGTTTQPILSVRKIVVTGVLAAVAVLLGSTRLGFIPVPNITGSATIMHVPAILGGILEGPLVGALIGTIFGLFSFLQATSPLFKNPLVSIFPRIWIGVVAYYAYILARPRLGEVRALALAGVLGSLTNTTLVLGMAVLVRLLPPAAIPPIIPQAIAEFIIAAFITVVVVTLWKRLETGEGGSSV